MIWNTWRNIGHGLNLSCVKQLHGLYNPAELETMRQAAGSRNHAGYRNISMHSQMTNTNKTSVYKRSRKDTVESTCKWQRAVNLSEIGHEDVICNGLAQVSLQW